MLEPLEFFVPGDPVPGGSKNPLVNQKTGKMFVVDSSGKRGKDWRKLLKEYAADAMEGRKMFSAPIRFSAEFRLKRPKTHIKPNGVLRSTAPKYHVKRPDALKLTRQVEDAFTGIVWRDDSEVAYEVIRKIYADSPGVWVRISELEDR